MGDNPFDDGKIQDKVVWAEPELDFWKVI
ncbi:hypothetical protein LCGC14_2980310, partial [marine sediment metagenome]